MQMKLGSIPHYTGSFTGIPPFSLLSPSLRVSHPMAEASSHQVGVLIPLNERLEAEKSLPELPVFEGGNVIGRNNVPVNDKRLSRKHITLFASNDDNDDDDDDDDDDGGYADLLVEGMNPVVINSNGQRKMLNSKEKAAIKNGDIVELIPGSYSFKYVILSSKRSSGGTGSGGDKEPTSIGVRSKRSREENSGSAAGHSKVLNIHEREAKVETSKIRKDMNGKRKMLSISVSNNSEEAIRHFHVSDDKIPQTFRLMKVRGLPDWANTSCVSIDDIIKGDVLVAILSNYMVDIDWLLSACPLLRKVPQVLVVHGESDGTLEYMKMNKPGHWIMHKPPLPISYGTHHSKAMLLVYPRGVRIIVHTANLINIDWNNKSQGLWMQDFPWKEQHEVTKGSPFESDLVDYLQALKLPEFTANLPAHGRFKIDASFFKKFDYGSAAVRLIASVPGYHSGTHLKKWGHMKLRSILEQCTFDQEFKQSPLVYQFSSLGSLDEKWMTELRSSMSSGLAADKTALGLGDPLIIWPTVEDVRWSLEGYAAGSAVPSPVKNVEKFFLKRYWAKWKATHTGRCRAMLHIKTFVRYNGQSLAWCLLTSANLSKAAWGALQKNNSQLMIRSYELGVLFLPTVAKIGCGFSCLDDEGSLKDKKESVVNTGVRKRKLVSLMWQGKGSDINGSEVVPFPLPYELPPHPYSSLDVPWSWDRQYNQKDVYGQVWPR